MWIYYFDQREVTKRKTGCQGKTSFYIILQRCISYILPTLFRLTHLHFHTLRSLDMFAEKFILKGTCSYLQSTFSFLRSVRLEYFGSKKHQLTCSVPISPRERIIVSLFWQVTYQVITKSTKIKRKLLRRKGSVFHLFQENIWTLWMKPV